ncbi:hypothetical protein A8B84_20535 [Marinobacter sp. EhC06]|nr:hypothetical protein A8B84_20535 [Marinobacter sp. EhC06]OAN93104.1 hypothetical protein A8B80_17850 [Marinobacter sp. EhN04]
MLSFASAISAAPSMNKLVERANAGDYSAPELYSPTYIRFDNGLQLVMLDREFARSVSFKVRVGVGMSDFECGTQEIPHALEHMVFGGLTDMPEAELEKRFWELGVSSNAYVAGSETVFEAAAFPSSLEETMALTRRMLTEGQFTEEQWQKTSDILWQEMGGEPTELERSSSTAGELASAGTKFLAEIDRQYHQVCPQYDQQSDVELEDIQSAYDRYYQPQNMLWVVVGDIKEEEVRDWAKANLATLENLGEVPDQKIAPENWPEQRTWEGYSYDSSVGLYFKTPSIGHPDYFPLMALKEWLDQRVYTALRIGDGSAYSPMVDFWADEHHGQFAMATDTQPGSHSKALARLESLLRSVTDQSLSDQSFQRFMTGILRSWAQSPETNEGYADFYIASLWEFETRGRLIHYERELAAVTLSDVQRVARGLLESDSKYRFINIEYPEDTL